MQIKKIKIIKEDEIMIQFTQSKGNRRTEISLKCEEKPAPSFTKTMENLIPYARDICEMSEDSKIKVLGISLSYHGEEQTQGVIITIQKKLKKGDACITINTPMKFVEVGTISIPETQMLNQNAIEGVRKVIEETIKYIEGIREQTNLFE